MEDKQEDIDTGTYNTPQTESQEGKTFFPVDTTSDLKNALASILNSINEYVGITDVEVTDNITSLTRVGITGVGDSATGFTYTRSGGRYGTAEQPWTEEDTTPPPHAVYYPEGQAPEGETAGVHWDLSTLGLLEDGVTYKVSFTVWPSQDAYDWVADLNNGIRTWEQVQAAGLDSHFIELDDPTRPSGHRYEVATNPPSKKPTGEITHTSQPKNCI